MFETFSPTGFSAEPQKDKRTPNGFPRGLNWPFVQVSLFHDICSPFYLSMSPFSFFMNLFLCLLAIYSDVCEYICLKLPKSHRWEKIQILWSKTSCESVASMIIPDAGQAWSASSCWASLDGSSGNPRTPTSYSCTHRENLRGDDDNDIVYDDNTDLVSASDMSAVRGEEGGSANSGKERRA